jgi:hypothetical protein
MTLTEFLADNPCIEELDGFMHALGQMAADPTIDPSATYAPLTTDQVQEADVYRKRLMKGQVVPYRSLTWRQWDYRFGKPPTRKPGQPPASDARSPAAASGSAAGGPPSDRADTQVKYLVAKPRR